MIKLSMPIQIAATVAVAGLAATSLVAQAMWQNLNLGMSLAEVQQAQPQAKRNPDPGKLYDGSKCLLAIASYEVSHKEYNVCFYFKSDKLNQVTLGFNGHPSKSDFDSVVMMLTAKYGQPVSVEKDAIGWSADWILPNGVNIAVIFIGEKPLTPLMNINYQYRLKTESGKL